VAAALMTFKRRIEKFPLASHHDTMHRAVANQGQRAASSRATSARKSDRRSRAIGCEAARIADICSSVSASGGCGPRGGEKEFSLARIPF
jgi:hypothetical protein